MSKKTYILGAVFGFLVPVVGVFAGLQISSMLGNILAAPFLLVAIVTNLPLGHWSGGVVAVGFFTIDCDLDRYFLYDRKIH